MNKIIFCTLRDNKGATGGPGGVLFLQKSILGEKINDFDCRYWFNTFDERKSRLFKLINPIAFFVRACFTRDCYFITHDIESGNILSLLGKKYSLIYHNQGPSIEELTNLGITQSSFRLNCTRKHERKAFIGAYSLHFPSTGAADMYFDSKYAECSRDEVKIGKPLFNIIPDVEDPAATTVVKEDNALTFFSLGTLTTAKGQDQVLEFLKVFLKYYEKPVRYIIVGKGPLKDDLIKTCEKMKEQFPIYNYQYIERVPHDEVMAIHNISDVYIMMHRISIFDFATLEAMSQKTAIVLSDIGGNPDFNKDNNVILCKENDYETACKSLVSENIDELKNKNYAVFKRYFSKEAFKKQYDELIEKLV